VKLAQSPKPLEQTAATATTEITTPEVTELNKSNESRGRKSQTPSRTTTEQSGSSTATTPTTKARRKRKPVVTSKVDCVVEDMDIETSLTTNVISFKDNPPAAAVDPQTPPKTAIKEAKPDSDGCETIDKIAQMVSNITSSPDKVPPPPPASVPANEDTKLIEIEHQLEEMFADVAATTTAPEEQPTQSINLNPSDPPIESTEAAPQQKPAKPKANKKKKKVEGAGSKKKAALKNNKKNGKNSTAKANGVTTNGKAEGKSKTKDSNKSKVKADVAPFLQIQKDGSFAIVNQTTNGDDDTEKAVSKPKKQPTNDKPKAVRGLHVSTLSNKYDADKRDLTWICIFCKLGPHKFQQGDLFGPYILSKLSEEYALCLEDPEHDVFRQSNANKFVKALPPPLVPEKPKKKRKNTETRDLKSPTPKAGASSESTEDVFAGMIKVDENTYEIWFHEDCIVYSSGVYIIGTKIMGIEAAVWSSTRQRCSYCHKNGAMLACLKKGCGKKAHVVCTRKSWRLDDEFKTFCDQHSVTAAPAIAPAPAAAPLSTN